MLNKEKYAKEIIDIACSVHSFGKHHGDLCACSSIDCFYCDFNTEVNCKEKISEWANSEYKEPEIDWTKVPVNTPVYVRNNSSNNWNKMHFCRFDPNNNLYYCYFNGNTSWSNEEISLCGWKQCKLAEGVECSEWYKD